jgi:hypothetical protein
MRLSRALTTLSAPCSNFLLPTAKNRAFSNKKLKDLAEKSAQTVSGLPEAAPKTQIHGVVPERQPKSIFKLFPESLLTNIQPKQAFATP